MLAAFADPPGDKKAAPSIIRGCELPQGHSVLQVAYASEYSDDDYYYDDTGEQPQFLAGIADNVKDAREDRILQSLARIDENERAQKVPFKASIFDDYSLLVSREQMNSSVLDMPLVTALPCTIIKPYDRHENEIDADGNELSQVETELSSSSNTKDEFLSVVVDGTHVDKRQTQQRRSSWISSFFSRRHNKPATARRSVHSKIAA